MNLYNRQISQHAVCILSRLSLLTGNIQRLKFHLALTHYLFMQDLIMLIPLNKCVWHVQIDLWYARHVQLSVQNNLKKIELISWQIDLVRVDLMTGGN